MDRLGSFRVVGELGRGGMGVVYLGVQDGLGRPVAIKVLPTADESLGARLRHEADVLADLQHPHVVGLIDVGEADGRPYLVMPYFPGGTLADVLRREGSLRPGQVTGLVAAIADALAAAHARGVLHRDVKPGNVLLSAQGDPYLSDFGIATGSSQTKTSTGELLGTVGYVAPETIAGQSASAAADVYALGVLAYTALAGRGPVVADNIMAALEAARTGRRVPLQEAAPGAPERLVDLVDRAMALDPAERPADLRAWAHQLRSAVPPEPVEPAADRALAMLAADAPTSMGARAAAVAADQESEADTVVGRGSRRRTALLAGVATAALLATATTAFLVGGGVPGDRDKQPLAVDGAGAEVIASPSATATGSSRPTEEGGSATTPPSEGATDPSVVVPPPLDTYPQGGTGGTSTGGTSTGGTGTGGTGTGGTGTGGTGTGGTGTGGGVPAVVSPKPTPKASPVAPKPAAPAAVTSGAARFTQVTARRGDTPEPTEVLVALAWQASSGGGAASSYELRRMLVSPSGSSVQATATVSGTSTTLRVPACHVGGGRYGWEVRARNAAGASAWTRLSATISDMRGEYGADATQMIRTAGAVVAYADAGNTPAPSGDQAWRTYNQSPISSTLAPGTSVRLWYYGDPAPAS